MKVTFQTTAGTPIGAQIHMSVEADVDPDNCTVAELRATLKEVFDLHNLFHHEHQAWSADYLKKHPEAAAELAEAQERMRGLGQPRPS